jgi:hypothetical protein
MLQSLEQKIHHSTSLCHKDSPHSDESIEDPLGYNLASSIALFLVYQSRHPEEEIDG